MVQSLLQSPTSEHYCMGDQGFVSLWGTLQIQTHCVQYIPSAGHSTLKSTSEQPTKSQEGNREEELFQNHSPKAQKEVEEVEM